MHLYIHVSQSEYVVWLIFLSCLYCWHFHYLLLSDYSTVIEQFVLRQHSFSYLQYVVSEYK